MGTGTSDWRGRMYFYKQGVLLSVTVLCLIFLTIPTVREIRDVANRQQIVVARNDAQQEMDRLQTEIKSARAEMLMSPSGSAAAEAMKAEEARLLKQLALLTEQLDDVQAKLNRVEAAVKGLPVESPPWHLLARLGHLMHVGIPAVTGTLFVVSWIRRRRDREHVSKTSGDSAEPSEGAVAANAKTGNPVQN